MRKVKLRTNKELEYLVIKKLVETNNNNKWTTSKLGCLVLTF